jgi:PfaD family protein
MFPMKANRLYEYYKNYDGIHEIPAKDRETLEKTVFRASLDEIWEETRRYFADKDPAQIERGNRDPKHKMALIFRWYLGKSSGWANTGDAGRKVDFQVWCGPAMGAFNEWTAGSFLEEPHNRRIVTVGQNILYGAAVLQRANSARLQGISLEGTALEPLTPERLQEYFY